MHRIHLWLAAAMVLAGTQTVHAQVLSGTEIERGLRFFGPAYDGEPYTQRYSYGTSGFLYINGDPRRLQYLDYLDRAERAEKFGYRMPIDPFFEAPLVEVHPGEVIEQPRVYGGFGFGRWRRR